MQLRCINKMHFNSPRQNWLDNFITDMFSRDGEGEIGGKKKNFFSICIRIDRGSLVLVKQWWALPRLGGKKKCTLDENSSRPGSRERIPISRLNQLFRRRSSARCYEHTCSLMFVLCTSRGIYTRILRACTQRNLYPVCWRCVGFIGNFRNCVRDA